jgi:hypothetical protein
MSCYLLLPTVVDNVNTTLVHIAFSRWRLDLET